MHHLREIPHHPVAVVGLRAVMAGLALHQGIGMVDNRTYPIPHEACQSPMAISQAYRSPGTTTLQAQTGFFTPGIVAEGNVSPDVYGIQVSFKAPQASPEDWHANASQLIHVDKAGHFTLKLAVADGAVNFGVWTVARPGSLACDRPPAVDFHTKDTFGYFTSPAFIPWENMFNITDTF